MITVALLPGDGVGPEVLAGPIELAQWLASQQVLSVTGPWPIGFSAYADCDNSLPTRTLAACDEADAVLLGAVGTHPGVQAPVGTRPELALLSLRNHFDLRASVREIWRSDGGSLTFVRNLLGGMYGSADKRQESDGTGAATDLVELSPNQIREIAEIAVQYLERNPSSSLISVDKANLLATSRLWRRTLDEVAAEHAINVRHVYVDRFAYELASRNLPNAVVVTEGLFGDILSDLACGRVGSIALASSASIRPAGPDKRRCVGIFEPLHGSAPTQAGKDRVNPVGAYLAFAMLLAAFPETAAWAPVVHRAVSDALGAGALTYELAEPGKQRSTSQVAAMINAHFHRFVSENGVPARDR